MSNRPLFSLSLLLLTVGLLLLVFGLRVHHLGAQSLWNDEGSSYVQATRSFSDIAANAARDIHPPGYYWLLAGWRLLAGESEFALRAPSVFASLLAAAFLFAIGRRFGSGTAALAVGFTALNTFSIYYAQEARMYALLALCAAALFWALLRLLERPTRRNILILGLVTAAGLYTQYAFPFFMVTGGLLALIAALDGSRTQATRLKVFTAFTAANLLALVLYAPWLPSAVRQVTTWPNTGEPIAAGEALAIISRWLTFGLTGEGATMAIPFVLLLFALIGVPRARLSRSALWPTLVPMLWVVVPLGLFLALGLFRPSNLKFLLPAQLGMALWLGRGTMVLWDGARDGLLKPGTRGSSALKLAGAAAALWLVFTQMQLLPPLYSDTRYQRADYRAIAARVLDELGAGDAVILDAPNQAEVFSYYYGRTPDDAPERASVYGLPAGLGGDDRETQAQMRAVIEEHRSGRVYAVFWGERERDPNRAVERSLELDAYPAGSEWFGDVRLARYGVGEEYPRLTPADETFTHAGGQSITLTDVYVNARSVVPGGHILVQLTFREAPLPANRLASAHRVFVQLLDSEGRLALQHDSSPTPFFPLPAIGISADDRHALLLPRDFPPGEYTLIMGIYPAEDANTRLRLPDGRDALEIARITVQP